MASEGAPDTDGSSIKPVSSLRSKFENLGQDQKQPPVSAGNRSPAFPRHARNADPTRMSLDLPRPAFYGSNGLGISSSVNAVAEPRLTPTHPSRPLSIGQFPSRQTSPPRVTVISPNSPPMGDAPDAGSLNSPQQVPVLRSGVSFPQSVSPRTLTGPIPSLPSRNGAANAKSSAENLQASVPSLRSQRSPNMGATKPPPVNRAGKPSLTRQFHGSATPGESLTLDLKQSKAISPFSTPPSSSESTPRDKLSPTYPDEQRRPRSETPKFGARSYFVPLSQSNGTRQLPLVKPEERSFERAPSLPTSNRPTPSTGHDGAQDAKRAHSSQGVRASLSRRGSPHKLSGRSSPSKLNRIPARALQEDPSSRVDPTPSAAGVSADSLGVKAVAANAIAKSPPPLLPAPRRSVETRRSVELRSSIDRAQRPLPGGVSIGTFDDLEGLPSTGTDTGFSEFPDASRANRRPPRYPQRPWELGIGYDTRLFTVCGEYVCSGGFVTRVWNIKTGESITSISHGEGIKTTSMAWIPAKNPLEEGQRLWLGTNMGDILQFDIPSRQIVSTRHAAHGRGSIVKIFRHASALWSLDDEGKLLNWRNNSSDSVASLDVDPIAHRTMRGHTASIVVGNCLWMAAGKDVWIWNLNANQEQGFQVLSRPLRQEDAGDITCVAKLSSQPNAVYFGHTDGKVSVYNKKDYSLIGIFNVSVYKVSAMTGVGNLLWAGYSTGTIFVYDTSTTPWTVKKEWRAHVEPICGIIADQSSIWKLDRFNVVTLGMNNVLRIWDGMLQNDWLEEHMLKRDAEYCDFQEITASVMTWNAGASKPAALRNNQKDDNFFREYFTSKAPADIMVFGFQELVDLEDKKVTAKSFFKSKKKDTSDHDKMSHQYRAWRDYLVRCLDEHMPPTSTYTLLQSANLVGLFTCVFVKTSLRPRIRSVGDAEVKRGMGGLHGNKGALILRMILDDSSICLINCHLAAGQTQTMHRNNDIAAILESENLPSMNDATDIFVHGGDGSMILDHEICILNGDLNYRIDAMTRDSVVRAVKDNNLTRLLERDQLLLSKKRNPAFRLRLFQEMPITFAPTYKYNVGTTEYDTSEKRRSPAWCDRVLFRGLGRIKCTEYRRWEVHASDHRPVTAHLKMRVKSIDHARRDKVLEKTRNELDQFRRKVKYDVMLDYFMNVLGLPQGEAASYLRT